MTVLNDVQGQANGVRYLRTLIEGRYNSPLLLVGDEGVGRRFSAIQAVKEAYCYAERESGCTCGACVQVENGVHPDLLILQPEEEGKLIRVDDVRDLADRSWVRPSFASRRFFIIDGVDRMTPEAANAMLKTLEEPPSKSRFILLTEFYDRVLPTIRSRCGKVSYQPLPEGFVLSIVQRFESDLAKASIYARMGEGSVGRSLSYWGSGRLGLRDRVYGLIQFALDRDLPALFSGIDSLGKDISLALRFVEWLLHDMLLLQYAPDRIINLDLAQDLPRVRAKASWAAWSRFGLKVRELKDRYRTTKINIIFGLKSTFVETLVGL